VILEEEPAPPPEDPGAGRRECVHDCKVQTDEWVQKCIDDGGTPERCRRQGAQKMRECVQSCPPAAREPRPREPEPRPRRPELRRCVGQCEKASQQLFRKCMAREGDPKKVECRRKAERFLRNCILRKCPREVLRPDPSRPRPTAEPRKPAPDPEQCRENCSKRAREFYRKCVDRGTGSTPPEKCASQAREMLAKCIDRCPPKVEPRPDPERPKVCVERCERKGRQEFRECREAGGAPERCENIAKKTTRQCIAENCP
jgi:hypothetical protein